MKESITAKVVGTDDIRKGWAGIHIVDNRVVTDSSIFENGNPTFGLQLIFKGSAISVAESFIRRGSNIYRPIKLSSERTIYHTPDDGRIDHTIYAGHIDRFSRGRDYQSSNLIFYPLEILDPLAVGIAFLYAGNLENRTIDNLGAIMDNWGQYLLLAQKSYPGVDQKQLLDTVSYVQPVNRNGMQVRH